MRRRAWPFVLAPVAVLGVALAIPTGATANEEVIAKMNGNRVVPGPGDPNGRGRAEINLKQRQRLICFAITYNDIARPIDAEIHKAGPGNQGPTKVTLFEGASADPATGCVREGARQIRRIRHHPAKFYLQVENGPFPNGAIRGQLRGHG